eukprot:gene2444-2482_t
MKNSEYQPEPVQPSRKWLLRIGRFGLGMRVSLLLVIFMILTEIMIFVPAIANVRLNWFNDRLAAAHTAALVFTTSPRDMIPDALAMEILDSVGSKTIAIRMHGMKRLLAVSDMPLSIDETIDLRETSLLDSIPGAARSLFASKNRVLNLKGPAPMGGDFIEIVLDDAPLQQLMRETSRTILGVSVLISGLLALLAAMSLHFMVLKPVRHLTKNLMSFAENPEDIRRIMVPSGAYHELGQAEDALSHMQYSLYHELKQKKHLAALGLAVAKINHDLRNMLASAQLFSDRLAMVTDPQARLIGTKLIATLDRAIGFCQSSLTYGRSVEQKPTPVWIDARPLLSELQEMLGLGEQSGIKFIVIMPDDLAVFADSEQLSRILHNILRNAVQALQEHPTPDHFIQITGISEADSVLLQIKDNGPGIPPHIKPGLFEAFQSSSKPGGTGLGLAIAAELVHAHGGTLSLCEQTTGTCFHIRLPHPAK